MNSPIEPASPISSSSTESLLLDDREPVAAPHDPPAQESSAHPHSTAPKSAAKRRLPLNAGRASGNRDAKTRRREDIPSRKGTWDGKDLGRMKEDFIDLALSDQLKNRIGDPFDEDIIKGAS
ncbi:hypothetical protein FA95DRAFT_1562285 [Auriscalpium vulgare]|uniref:Uncharacterized protein n=1 Tax=Auriscalpium vulgare TaxID=40419 RepID=A0ACB8RJX2_9AGAM|nr:hypothetical protein FA95DRAFT_1562285 [Auriscalpium vulgare]